MKFKNLNHAFYSLLKKIDMDGLEVNSRGSKQLELLFQQFEIEDPTALMINFQARKFSSDYATAEWLWYLSANPCVNNIGKLAKIWLQIQDANGEAESNYGCYLKPQWKWTIDELLKDRDTRRATIVVNQPYHKGKNKLDYPCTHYLHFFIRNDRLHLGVNMRSNDVVFGFCNDVFTFCMFQQLMLNELNTRGAKISLGSYHHHAGSLHLYERHFAMSKNILEEGLSSENARKFVLAPELTWQKMVLSRLLLPNKEISKTDIKEFVTDVAKEIYNEHS
jgi:thymidylate synthase